MNPRCGRFELLDVGSGSGDVPLALVRRFERRGVRLSPTLLDQHGTHLPQLATAVIGDALDLPFPPESFDLVTCSLLVHHFEPPMLKRFVQEALRVARIALIINDLRRSRLHLALATAARPLFRSRMAWRDGIVSIRRAYTQQELRGLLAGSRAPRRGQPALFAADGRNCLEVTRDECFAAAVARLCSSGATAWSRLAST